MCNGPSPSSVSPASLGSMPSHRQIAANPGMGGQYYGLGPTHRQTGGGMTSYLPQNLPGSSRGEMSTEYSVNQPPANPTMYGQTQALMQSQAPPMDARMAFLQNNQRAMDSGPSPAYSPMAGKGMGEPYQNTAGTFPGATPPPGWQAPPPGPFAGMLNPMTASFLGRGGLNIPGAMPPPGANAFNANTNQWMQNFPWYNQGQ